MKEDNNITCYSLNIGNKWLHYIDAKRCMYNIYRQMKRVIEKDPKFKGLSFIIGVSNTYNKAPYKAEVIYEHTGKKGRPKRVVKGRKIKYHIHIFILSENGMVSTFCDVMKGKLAYSKENYIVSKNANNNYKKAIEYMNQCDSILTYGDFKFHDYYS